jgi:hypothetical protein
MKLRGLVPNSYIHELIYKEENLRWNLVTLFFCVK